LNLGDSVGFDDYQVELELTADNQIKHAHMNVKSLLYGVNQTKRERNFNGKFNMTTVVSQSSKSISGCLNALRKMKICKTVGDSKTDVLSMVSLKELAKLRSEEAREEHK
jgi:hypothetical protein